MGLSSDHWAKVTCKPVQPSVSPPGAVLSSGRHVAVFECSFGCHDLERKVTGAYWALMKDAAHPTMHKVASSIKNCPIQNTSSARFEESWSSLSTK